MVRRIRGALCPHKWKWSDQRFDPIYASDYPASGMHFTATNCECEQCGKRTWAHGRRA